MDRVDRLFSVVVILSGALFLAGAFAGFNQNDFMYATAPVFWSRLALYQDLAFVQAPGSIFVYGLIYHLVGPADFHLVLRVFSLAILFLALLFIYHSTCALAGRLPARVTLLFILTSIYVLSIGREIGNTPLALLFLSGALFVYFTKPLDFRSSALIGLLIGFAATGKLNFALYAIPFGLFLIFKLGFRSREFLAYILGGLVGSCMIWYYIFSDFSHFWFFNIRFHALMNLQRETTGWQPVRSVAVAAAYFLFYSSPAVYLIIKAARLPHLPVERRQFLELGALLVTALVAALLPMYSAPQYFAPPVFVLSVHVALSTKILMRQISSNLMGHCWSLRLFVPFCLIIWMGPLWAEIFSADFHGLTWDKAPPIQIREMRDRIGGIARSYLNSTSCNLTAISLSPVPLLGTAFKISPFSATGPFLPIVALQVREYAPEFSRYVSLSGGLDRSQATAFLVGFFPEVATEREFIKYARKNNFVAFNVGTLPGFLKDKPFYEMHLLVRRSCMSGRPAASQRHGAIDRPSSLVENNF